MSYTTSFTSRSLKRLPIGERDSSWPTGSMHVASHRIAKSHRQVASHVAKFLFVCCTVLILIVTLRDTMIRWRGCFAQLHLSLLPSCACYACQGTSYRPIDLHMLMCMTPSHDSSLSLSLSLASLAASTFPRPLTLTTTAPRFA